MAGSSRSSPAMKTTSVASLRPYRVSRTLNKSLQFRDVLFLQLAREVGHALVAERSLEHEVLQAGDGLLGDIAEVSHVAALVDAGHAVTEHAVAEVNQRAFADMLRIVGDAGQQALGLILYELRRRGLAVDHVGVDRARALRFRGALQDAEHAAPADRDRDV